MSPKFQLGKPMFQPFNFCNWIATIRIRNLFIWSTFHFWRFTAVAFTFFRGAIKRTSIMKPCPVCMTQEFPHFAMWWVGIILFLSSSLIHQKARREKNVEEHLSSLHRRILECVDMDMGMAQGDIRLMARWKPLNHFLRFYFVWYRKFFFLPLNWSHPVRCRKKN